MLDVKKELLVVGEGPWITESEISSLIVFESMLKGELHTHLRSDLALGDTVLWRSFGWECECDATGYHPHCGTLAVDPI